MKKAFLSFGRCSNICNQNPNKWTEEHPKYRCKEMLKGNGAESGVSRFLRLFNKENLELEESKSMTDDDYKKLQKNVVNFNNYSIK